MKANTVIMNRGDSTIIGINYSTDGYSFTTNDKLYFGLMDKHQRFEDALVKKILTFKDVNKHKGVIVLSLTPNDTLDLVPGTYYYSLKLRHIEKENKIDEVVTIVDRAEFIIND